jgi:hypothetical protein
VYNVELNEKRRYTIVDDSGKLFVYPPYRFEVIDNSPITIVHKTVRAKKSIFNGKKTVIESYGNYVVLDESEKYYFVVNDSGQVSKYPKSNFQIVRG